MEKPSWFEASKYDEAKSFDLKDWFAQLSARHILLQEEGGPLHSENRMKIFEKIKTDTFLSKNGMPLIFSPIAQLPTNIDNVSNKRLVQNFIWSTTISEVADNYKKLIDSCVDTSNLFTPADIDGVASYYINTGQISLLEEVAEAHLFGRKTLTVDLNGRKNEIINDFKKWLDEAKSNYDKKTKTQIISESKISLWAKRRILAYLDLLIWSKLDAVEIDVDSLLNWVDEGGEMEGAIFDIVDRRSRYSDLYQELMSFEFILRLFRDAHSKNGYINYSEFLINFMEEHNLDKKDFL